MSKPAEWFKIWMVIIMKCNYEDNWIYKRGEIITKYENLAIECGVSRNTIKSFIDWARGATLVTPQQLKRGVKIKVNNYDKYQGWMTPSTPPTMLPSTPAINKGIQKDRKTETLTVEFFEKELERVGDSSLNNSLREWWKYKKGKYTDIWWQKQITIVLKYPTREVCDRIDEAIASWWEWMNLSTMKTNWKAVEKYTPIKEVVREFNYLTGEPIINN